MCAPACSMAARTSGCLLLPEKGCRARQHRRGAAWAPALVRRKPGNRTIHGPVEHGRCVEPLKAERGDHRVRLPVTAGRVIPESCPTRTPAVATEEIGRDATFIEKDVVNRAAAATRAIGDAQPPRRAGVVRRRLPFFLTVNWSRSNARQTDDRLAELCNASRSSASVRSGWASTNVRNRSSWPAVPGFLNTCLGPWPDLAGLAPPLHQAINPRTAHPKLCRDLFGRQSRVRIRQHPRAQVHRIRRHSSLPAKEGP